MSLLPRLNLLTYLEWMTFLCYSKGPVTFSTEHSSMETAPEYLSIAKRKNILSLIILEIQHIREGRLLQNIWRFLSFCISKNIKDKKMYFLQLIDIQKIVEVTDYPVSTSQLKLWLKEMLQVLSCIFEKKYNKYR